MLGTLYLVATPIGNLDDITFRAVETLKSVGIVACEDTRHSRKLLNHLGIKSKLVSYHEHNELTRTDELATALEAGVSVAVISDAGTPGISDPSYRIVQRAIEVGAPVVPIPGPAAFVSAVIASGLPADSVYFGGFLPSKKSERRRRFQELADIQATLVFYESPRRVAAAIDDSLEILGDRNAVVAREITKLHEEFIRGTLSSIRSKLSATLKGEVVLLIDRSRGTSGPVRGSTSLADRLAEIEAEGVDHKMALKRVAREFGLSRSETYRRIQSERK